MILYSLDGCPACKMLKQKLDQKKIQYEVVNDPDLLEAKGISHVPLLETDEGEVLDLKAALELVRKVGEVN